MELPLTRGQDLKRFKLGRAGQLLSFTTTIVNHTESRLPFAKGPAIVDGRNLFPLPVVASKGATRAERNQAIELANVVAFRMTHARTKLSFVFDFVEHV